MKHTSVRTAEGMDGIVEKYGDLLYRVCYSFLHNRFDAEDAVQETLISYFLKNKPFYSEEHEKAWLLRVAVNKSKDILRQRKTKETLPEELIAEREIQTLGKDSPVFDALLTLPEKYRTALLLHYVEGYKAREVAEMLGLRLSAVKMRLQKGRKLLFEAYNKEMDHGTK